VYQEESGELLMTGHFVVKGTQRGVPSAELTFNAFDGVVIHLADGRELVKVD
jgi:hypothetical protein